VLREAVDPRFEFVRYAESLAQSQAEFRARWRSRAGGAAENLIDRTLRELTLEATGTATSRRVVLLSVPRFPGNVYGAFRIAQAIKAQCMPPVVTVLGGGLRQYRTARAVRAARVRLSSIYVTSRRRRGGRCWPCSITCAGKRPHRAAACEPSCARQGTVRYVALPANPTFRLPTVGTPTWDGLPLDRYLSLLDMLNPMHRLWSDATLEQADRGARLLLEEVQLLRCLARLHRTLRGASPPLPWSTASKPSLPKPARPASTFVDEAAPPKALQGAGLRNCKNAIGRFPGGPTSASRSPSPPSCASNSSPTAGCIAVSGGLEVASDRLLKLMQKGVSVAQVARVTRGFTDAGILVHAYLMYGFPTQTVQDTVDALEYVRQLFAAGCIQSGFFHRFTCSVHAPVGLNPAQFGVSLCGRCRRVTFAKNDVGFIDPTGVDHDALGKSP
jgi:hypothetical protein